MLLKRTAACAIILSLLVAAEGPGLRTAAATMVAAQSAQGARVVSVPQLGAMPAGAGPSLSLAQNGSTLLGGTGLPGLSALPGVENLSPRTIGAAAAPGVVRGAPIRTLSGPKLQAAPVAGAAESGRTAPVAAESKDATTQARPAKRSWRNLFGLLKGRSKRKEEKRKGPDFEQQFIDRVIQIEEAIERAERGENPGLGALKAEVDRSWDNGRAELKTVAAEKAKEAAEKAAAKEASGRSPKKAPGLAKSPKKTRAPPSWYERWKVPVPQPKAKGPSRLRQALKSAPSPVWIGLAGALTVAADFAARLLWPTVFGFAPAAALWVTVGMGAVVAPALIAARLKLSKEDSPAVKPLARYMDILLGLAAGAAAVTVVGILATGANPVAILFAGFPKAAGLIGLAPFLGMVGLVAAMPVLYGAGHVAEALKRGRITTPSLPLNFIFKLFLLNIIFNPGKFFILLSGTAVQGILPMALMLIPFWTFIKSQSFLGSMTARHASADEISRERMYAALPAMRGLLDPVPVEMFKGDWRFDKTQGPKTSARAELKKSRIGSYFWLGALVLGSLGILALHQLSVTGAIEYALPILWSTAKMFVPMFLLSGFMAALFQRTKRTKEGPIVDMVRELAGKLGLPMPRVYAGKTTGPPNAFAAGALHHLSVVAVIGSITRLLSPKELFGVMGHEMSHVKFRHMLSFFIGIPFLQLLSLGAANLFQLSLAYWAPLAWVFLFLAISRANERMADSGAAKALGESRGLATGLRKMSVYGALKSKIPHHAGTWIYKLFLSHPDPRSRVSTLHRMEEAKLEEPQPRGIRADAISE